MQSNNLVSKPIKCKNIKGKLATQKDDLDPRWNHLQVEISDHALHGKQFSAIIKNSS